MQITPPNNCPLCGQPLKAGYITQFPLRKEFLCGDSTQENQYHYRFFEAIEDGEYREEFSNETVFIEAYQSFDDSYEAHAYYKKDAWNSEGNASIKSWSFRLSYNEIKIELSRLAKTIILR